MNDLIILNLRKEPFKSKRERKCESKLLLTKRIESLSTLALPTVWKGQDGMQFEGAMLS
jgi:hypothetical protein